MALKPQNTSSAGGHTFNKGLNEDVKNFQKQPTEWTQARNAVNNTELGDLGTLSNEQSNKLCALAPYTIIGSVHATADKFVIYSTDNTNSEIGLFDESECSYTKLVNDACLNFSTDYLITGQSKKNFQCEREVYWSDGLNPDRVLNIDRIPYKEDCVVENDCVICTPTTELDCEALRLEPLVDNLSFSVKPGATSGELLNGSYFVSGAYLINGQKFGDYSAPSQIQGLWAYENSASSIDVTVEFADERFDEFELIITSFVNYQLVAKRAGVYSTRQKLITIDQFQNNWPIVNEGDIIINNPINDKSDAIWRNGDYLLRVGPTSKFDFNYQPIANQIKTEWISVEYPENYYGNGGNNTGYMRDEVYSFFIRWVYNTGDKSPSFHIPGRFSQPSDLVLVGGRDAAVDIDDGLDPYKWRVHNTAIVNPTITPYTLPDGGKVLGGGDMGYWESSELYEDDKPQMWNATYTDPVTGVNIGGTSDTRYDLCGKPIRHHKFPANQTAQGLHPITHHVNADGTAIRVMAVRFSNVKRPLDNLGNEIENVVGYEILRGSREGNKSIFYKGMICNMRDYDIIEGVSNKQGLYQNYPFNNLGVDKYLQSNFPVVGNWDQCKHENYQNYRKDVFSFHSPDTNFKDPYLSAKEIVLYGEQHGLSTMNFQFPDKHPKHKFLTDASLFASIIVGIAYPITQNLGKRSFKKVNPKSINVGGIWGGTSSGFQPFDIITGHSIATGVIGGYYGGRYLGVQQGAASDPAVIGAALFPFFRHPQQFYDQSGGGAIDAVTAASPGVIAGHTEETVEGTDISTLGPIVAVAVGITSFVTNWMKGIDMFLDIIRSVSPYQQYALQCISHCEFNKYERPKPDNTRRAISNQSYVGPALTDFSDYRINNIFRTKFVAIETSATIPENRIIDDPKIVDTSTVTLNQASLLPNGPNTKKVDKVFNTTASAHYAALKQRIRNQYGQINGIVQVPVSYGTIPKNSNEQYVNGPSSTDIMFNGDIYVGRYTEKNTMFYFYDWLYDQPDGYEFNYFLRQNASYVSYWADTDLFDIAELTGSLGIDDLINLLADPSAVDVIVPSSKFCLDTVQGAYTGAFLRVNSYFYLFNSGVKDFFVESEVNLDYRGWENSDEKRHYDPKRFTHLPSMFNAKPDIIKAGNLYKYDWSLSISRLYNNFLAWGATQSREYDPKVAETCYTYRPNRIIYSLPQRAANKQDYWRIFLPFNYKDFTSRPRAVKQFSKNGALILFDNISPVTFAGVDQLQTDADTKLVIGDGGLFSQPLQNLANAEWPIEYGSCQDKYSAINTPAGFYYISQNQGKVFTLAKGSIQEISNIAMKWWFAEFLPYRIIKDFPDFKLQDNPVAGVGCQTIYDNLNQIVYFSKKDYELKKDLPESMQLIYSGDSDVFYIKNTLVPIKLGDPLFFNSASWTVSFDPKSRVWVSYHDWHPDLTIASKNTFLSTKKEGIWQHNTRCDSFCNFYGKDYPFEVEFSVHTANTVNTLRNIEYYMEAYKYAENCYDRFHDLDFNFDEAIIYNSEQVSGLLRLNLMPKNNAPEILKYPKVNFNNIDILYSKVEQKYRFNQFWDVTADRGEFNSVATRTIFNTEPNGYIRNLNENNINYNKEQLQRKKFRHYKNTVLLRRKRSGDRNIIVNTALKMNLKSPR